MKRRKFFQIIGGSVAALSFPYCITINQAQKPNIIFILADDLGWNNPGFMGSKYHETPNIDRLANQSVTFTNAYTNAPNCAPTRASIMTGQYTPRHGIFTVNNSDRGQAALRKLVPIKNKTILDKEKITIAEALKQAGYVSASIGKWHLGDDPEFGPEDQGFDVNVGGNRAGKPESYFSPYDNDNLTDGPPGEHLTERLTSEALSFIENNKNQPFFLYLPYFAVHTPLQAKKDIIEKYKQKPGTKAHNNPTFAAMLESVDQGVGKILDKLEALNLSENTMVIFFSDNGGVRKINSMEPLRGGKGMLYEGGIRVPLTIRWPNHIVPGSTCDVPVIGIDFFPTLMEIAGVMPPEGQVIDGLSLTPLFSGEKRLQRQAIFWHFPAYLQGKAEGARDPFFRTRPGGAVRAGDWKLIEYFEDSMLELYNLENDPGETDNLSKKMPEKTKELHDILIQWRLSIKAPVPTQLNPNYKKIPNPKSQ